jgi:hypothetical protein
MFNVSMWATERNLEAATGKATPTLIYGNLMTIDSTAAPPQTTRISGTLHKRGYAHPAPLEDENLPREKAEESEVAGRHDNSGQKDHKGAR